MRVYKTLGIMKINFILALFAATVLSSSGYRLATQPAEFINIPFAEPATMDGRTKTLNINIWKGVGDDPQPVVLFVSSKPMSPRLTPDDPPVLILNGQKDSRVASAQSVKLYQALYDAGIEATLLK